MRIALFVHCFYPSHFYGTEAYTLAVAKELAALGHEPTVVSAVFPGEPAQAEPIERYSVEGIPVVSIDKNRLPNRQVRDTYDQPEMRPVLDAVLDELDPEVVHVCHLINHTRVLLDAAAARAIPAFATLTDFFGFCFNNKLEADDGSLCAGPSPSRHNCLACYLKARTVQPGAPAALRAIDSPRLRRPLSRGLAAMSRHPALSRRIGTWAGDLVARPDILARSLGTYRAAITPSRFLRDAYAANGFAMPLHLSHFGIEIDRRPKPPSREPGTVRLGYVGQIAAHKGVHLLVEALRLVGSPNLSLDVFGPDSQDPGYYAGLRRSADGLQVAFRGTFPTERMADVLGGLDVLVIPSTWYENSPLILLQALATHTPVVVADVLGLTEFVAHGRDGFHFRRGDAADLARQLARFAQDPSLAREMSPAVAYPRRARDMALDVLSMYEASLPGAVLMPVAGPGPRPPRARAL